MVQTPNHQSKLSGKRCLSCDSESAETDPCQRVGSLSGSNTKQQILLSAALYLRIGFLVYVFY